MNNKLMVFISQPMANKTNGEIENERKSITDMLIAKYGEIEIIDSFFKNAPHNAKPLWFLGKSLELLSCADIVVFAKNWQNYRGCRIENLCAKEYGIKTIIEL